MMTIMMHGMQPQANKNLNPKITLWPSAKALRVFRLA
jgi:hypothetical protein